MPPSQQNILDPGDGWEPFLLRHQSALLLFARQFLASPQEAQDAVQDGFIRFWKSRHTARDPQAYLFACVRSAALDLRRSRQSARRREQTLAAEAPQLTGPPEIDDRRRMLESAMATLPQDQREVLVLKIWSDLTFAQIAQALHVPANTAASRYRYAIQRLQSLLALKGVQ